MSREEKKYEEVESHAKKHIYAKIKTKKRKGMEGEKREKRYGWIAIYFEETIHWRYSV